VKNTEQAGTCDHTVCPCDARRPRRGMPEAERRTHLLEVASTVFIRDGYAATNMDDIARGAGMSKKTVYKLFPSKAALFEAVVVDQLAPLRFGIDDAGLPLEEALNRRLLDAAELLLSPAKVGLCRLVIAEGPRYPELAEAFHRADLDSGASSLERWLAAQAAAGRLEVEDARDTAHMLWGMAIGSLHIELLLGMRGPPSPAEVRASVHRATRVFLDGARRG
jgi:AcrR family transcriptional regulator